MKIFLTGATGFVGTRLVKRLHADGHNLTALVRSGKPYPLFEALHVQTVQGALENISEWHEAMRGHDVVIHLAAPPDFWGDWELFYNGITRATKQLHAAAADMGVKRFIFISSEAALQDSDPLLNIDETYPPPKEPNSYRGKAKLLAEQALLASDSRIHTIILRPAYIWGDGNKGIPTMIGKIRSGRFMWIDHGRSAMEAVHAENAAEAIRLACTRGGHKQVYFVTDGRSESVREHFLPVLQRFGIDPGKKNIPGWLAKPAAALLDMVWKRLKLKNAPPVSKYDWYFVGVPRKYNTGKIRRELGYAPVFTREQGLQELNASNKPQQEQSPTMHR